MLVASAPGEAAPAALWGYPRLTNSEAADLEIGWSARGTRGFLWRRDPPAEKAVTVQFSGRRGGARPRGASRAKGAARRSPEERLRRHERPLAIVATPACTPGERRGLIQQRRLVLIRIPLAEPFLLSNGPISMRFTYRLEGRKGWAKAQIISSANEASTVEVPGGTEGTGHVHLWLDPNTVRQARGISAAVRLTLWSRQCGRALFSLDSVELDQD